MLQLTAKQNEYIRNANHRWNVKSGAVRSGKSFVDTAFVVPARLRERHGKAGLNVILGVSRDTIERNVLQPMREVYTSEIVGTINSSTNKALIAGEEVYCLGAEKVSQVAKIQGSSIKYCYGDEVCKWSEPVFAMLQSRLDKPYSCFDGSCNPEYPTHWFKRFLDKDNIDLYLQEYTIFDNPFLPKEYVENLCNEYYGTIQYDRLIDGKWKRAEGAIYKRFADNPDSYACHVGNVLVDGVKCFRPSQLDTIVVGVDFGGNQSGHAFVATGFFNDYKDVVGLSSKRVMARDSEVIDANVLDGLIVDFLGELVEEFGSLVETVYWDNAESVLGASITNAIEKAFPWMIVRPAKKTRIKDRIDCTVRLHGARRLWIRKKAETLRTAWSEAVWDKKQNDVRLDDGTSDIDTLDAFEYTIERDIKMLIGG